MIPSVKQSTKPEPQAVIGGGIAAIDTAINLGRQTVKDPLTGQYVPRNHVHLFCPELFDGATLAMSRLHTGGEYPKDDKTAAHCVLSRLIWELAFRDDIYTKVPDMKFFVAKNTEESGKLTCDEYEQAYAQIKHICSFNAEIIKRLISHGGTNIATTLLGNPNDLFRRFKEDEKHLYPDYNRNGDNLAGGFQSKEKGLNIPKYLMVMQQELQEQIAKGNITLHKEIVSDNGITKKTGDDLFTIKCNSGKQVRAKHVVVAAWHNTPRILANWEKQNDNKQRTHVHQRAMLYIDLPPGWKTGPAFCMLDKDGWMLSPYNDKVAICYRPVKEAAYIKDTILTADEPQLPKDWEYISTKADWMAANNTKTPWDFLSDHQQKQCKKNAEEKARIARAKTYYELLQQKIPALDGWSFEQANARLIVRNTLSFDKDLTQRPNVRVQEIRYENRQAPSLGLGLTHGLEQVQEQQQSQELQLEQESESHSCVEEVVNGIFKLQPTKGTYGIQTAVEAMLMVTDRSENPHKETIKPPSYFKLLQYICSEEGQKTVSFKHRKAPDPSDPKDALLFQKFCFEHPELPPKIGEDSWEGLTAPNAAEDNKQERTWATPELQDKTRKNTRA